MTDPIDELIQTADEPVPQEIVLSAVRLFRYRALATVGGILATVAVLGLALVLSSRTDPEDRGAALAGDREAVHIAVAESEVIGGVRIALTEIVWKDGTGFARITASTEIQPEFPEVMVEVLGVEALGETSSYPDSSTLDLDLRHQSAGRWVEFSAPEVPWNDIAVEVLVLPVPREISENGGELSARSGTTAHIRYERATP